MIPLLPQIHHSIESRGGFHASFLGAVVKHAALLFNCFCWPAPAANGQDKFLSGRCAKLKTWKARWTHNKCIVCSAHI